MYSIVGYLILSVLRVKKREPIVRVFNNGCRRRWSIEMLLQRHYTRHNYIIIMHLYA